MNKVKLKKYAMRRVRYVRTKARNDLSFFSLFGFNRKKIHSTKFHKNNLDHLTF